MHTLGPWKAERRIEVHDDSNLNEVYYSIDLDTANQLGYKHSGYVARIDGMRGERQEANARLIATAPELLEALEIMIERLEYVAFDSGIDSAEDSIAMTAALTAIHKARGE